MSNPITIFAVPKPFEGHIGLIQRNAIKSWTLLQPQPQIILFGVEPEINTMPAASSIHYVSHIKRNENGVPLLDHVFQQARKLARGHILAYVNSDIILFNDFVVAVSQLCLIFDKFLMIGRRIDANITKRLNFEQPCWEAELRHLVAKEGALASAVCKDYFVFPNLLYANIPDFTVGRGNWDNWMVYQAHISGVPVVDVTDVVTVIHQQHDYAHLPGGRLKAYTTGGEARQNAVLAGGFHLVKGSAANWRLTSSGLKCKRLPPLFSFLADMPRFSKLLLKLIGLK